MRRFLLLLLGLVLLFSCTQDPAVDPAVEPDPGSPYAISQEEALRNLSDALASIDTPQTRGGHPARRVAEVTALSRADFLGAATRAELPSEDRLNRVYLVAFEDGEGSAILAADTRLEPVIAIYDDYQIKREDLEFIGEKVEGLPTPDRKPEDYYCAEDDDYYLGMSDGAIDEFDFQRDILVEYIKAEDIGGTVHTKEGEWKSVDSVDPMLTTQWHQGTPFNNHTPNNDPAGCVAVATAQIMAYNEFPRDYSNWQVAKTYKPWEEYPNTSVVDMELAVLSRQVGRGCRTEYDADGSSSTAVRAKKFLREVGYCGTVRHIGYDADAIVSCLKNDCPVFIGANTSNGHGHAWVIDGFVFRQKTDTTYCGETAIEQETHEQLLLHCNWGWANGKDGYFVSKVFDANNGRVAKTIDLPGTRGESTNNYVKYFRIITYDKP